MQILETVFCGYIAEYDECELYGNYCVYAKSYCPRCGRKVVNNAD